ncbi:MAG: hypothetical protein U5L73_01785 [Rhodoferax sp.]|uniref:hypothetical protein n=1 Tax=Rhodoferax sp. TaxID=50421 RepID=UPI002ACE1CF7|nr:hypothetical protein [Rhodoferax sp.]MDZ7890470.1 hypothetical protein [Rhodoferax sp.]
MATARTPVARVRWNSRWVEWGILTLCIAIATAVLWRYGQQVRAQTERAAVQSTLGALRTALVLDYVQSMLPQRKSTGGPVAANGIVPNPFGMLQQPAANYAGEVPAALLQEVAPGRWVFDQRCGCIGYKPLEQGGLDAPAGVQAIWFMVESTAAAYQLRPIQAYVWGGLPVE